MKKILLISMNFPLMTGGVSKVSQDIATVLSSAYQVNVLAPWSLRWSGRKGYVNYTKKDVSNFDVQQPYNIQRISYRNGPQILTMLSILWLNLNILFSIIKNKPDYIYFTQAYPYTFFVPFIQVFNKSIFVHCHGSEFIRKRSSLIGQAKKSVLHYAKKIIVVSSWGKEMLVGAGIPAEKIVIINPKVDVNALFSEPKINYASLQEKLRNKTNS